MQTLITRGFGDSGSLGIVVQGLSNIPPNPAGRVVRRGGSSSDRVKQVFIAAKMVSSPWSLKTPWLEQHALDDVPRISGSTRVQYDERDHVRVRARAVPDAPDIPGATTIRVRVQRLRK